MQWIEAPVVIGDEYWETFNPVLSTSDLERIYRVKAPTIYKKLEAGVIPGFRIGGAWIVYRESVAKSINDKVPHRGLPLQLLAELPDDLTLEHAQLLYGKKAGTIYSWLQRGILPGRRIGKAWIMNRGEHIALLEQSVHLPPEEGSG